MAGTGATGIRHLHHLQAAHHPVPPPRHTGTVSPTNPHPPHVSTATFLPVPSPVLPHAGRPSVKAGVVMAPERLAVTTEQERHSIASPGAMLLDDAAIHVLESDLSQLASLRDELHDALAGLQQELALLRHQTATAAATAVALSAEAPSADAAGPSVSKHTFPALGLAAFEDSDTDSREWHSSGSGGDAAAAARGGEASTSAAQWAQARRFNRTKTHSTARRQNQSLNGFEDMLLDKQANGKQAGRRRRTRTSPGMDKTFMAGTMQAGDSTNLSSEEEDMLAKTYSDHFFLQRLAAQLRQILGRQATDDEMARATSMDVGSFRKRRHLASMAMKMMLSRNSRLVVSTVRPLHKPAMMSMPDLVAAGMLGLRRAAELFDPSKGYKFSTYATWWIRQMALRAMLKQNNFTTVTLPVGKMEDATRLVKTRERMEGRLGRPPSPEELAAELNWSMLRVRNALEVRHLQTSYMSLDAPVFDDGQGSGLDLLEQAQESGALDGSDMDGSTAGSYGSSSGGALEDELTEVLVSALDQRAADVMRMRYAIGNDVGVKESLAKVGDKMHLSRERIRQIEMEILTSLRADLKDNKALQEVTEALLGSTSTGPTARRSSGMSKQS